MLKKIHGLSIVMVILITLSFCIGSQAKQPKIASGEDKCAIPYLVAASNAPQNIIDIAGYVCNGTADDEQINDALDNYKYVELSEGTFTIDNPIEFPSGGKELKGSGYQTAITPANGFNNTIIQVDYTSVRYQIIMRDFLVDGNKDNQSSGIGVDITGTGSLIMDNVYITKVKGYGIYCDGLTQTTNEPHITNSIVSQCGDDGIRLEWSWGFEICDMSYIGNNDGNGIAIVGGGESGITNCEIDENGDSGILLYSTDRMLITSCPYIGDNGDCGVRISSTAYDVVLSSCLILENGSVNAIPDGVRIDGAAKNITIDSCRIWDNNSGDQDDGIDINADAENIFISDCNLDGNLVNAINDRGATNVVLDNNYTG